MFISLKKILELKKGIVHFHDPELIFIGVVLKIFGWKVVYDVHEDNKLGIKQKEYLPSYTRIVASFIISIIEEIANQLFYIVLAEKAYQYRFKKGTLVLNYPVFSKGLQSNKRDSWGNINLIYTGSITVDRGALKFAEILRAIPNAKLYVVGRCDKQLKQIIKDSALDVIDRLHLHVREEGYPFPGIAVFPKTDHYYEKELTKFFEYMQYGIPIMCSDFPVWRNLVKGNQSGVCIDSECIMDGIKSQQTVIQNKDDWVEMSQNAFRSADNYSWESQLEKLVNLYKRIIG